MNLKFKKRINNLQENKSYFLWFCVIDPHSSLLAMLANILPASLAKSKSLTSCGETGTIANASLSSFIEAHPT